MLTFLFSRASSLLPIRGQYKQKLATTFDKPNQQFTSILWVMDSFFVSHGVFVLLSVPIIRL